MLPNGGRPKSDVVTIHIILFNVTKWRVPKIRRGDNKHIILFNVTKWRAPKIRCGDNTRIILFNIVNYNVIVNYSVIIKFNQWNYIK